MTEKTIQLSAFIAIRDQAAADLQKARKELERAQAKVGQAEVRLKAYEEAITQLEAGDAGLSQKEMILQVITKHDGSGLTAKEILTQLQENGFQISAQNKAAAVHVAAEQLQKDGLVEALAGENGKIFRRKTS